MPRIVDRLATAERSRMFSDDPPVLADHGAVGIGMDFDRTPDGIGGHGVFVAVEAHQASLRHCRRRPVEAVEPAWTSFGRSASNTSQIVCSVSSGMAIRACACRDALSGQADISS